MRIGIDIDGVLARFSDGFADLLNAKYKPGIVPENHVFTRWGWPDLIQPGLENIGWELVAKAPWFWGNLEPYWDNVVALRSFLFMFEKDVEVFYVTARGRGDGSVIRQTNLWLQCYELLKPNTSLIVLPGTYEVQGKRVNKGDMYTYLNIEASIDDYHVNVKHALRAAAKYNTNHAASLLTRDWNVKEAEFDAFRLATLKDWLKLVEEEIEIRKENK